MTFPYLKDWWVIIETDEDETHEGRMIDVIGDTVIIEEADSNGFRLGVALETVVKLTFHKTRPGRTANGS
jgi:hypothetical protein